MKADWELIDLLKKRHLCKKKMQEQAEPHGPDRFRHIFAMGEASAFREILMVLGVDLEETEDANE